MSFNYYPYRYQCTYITIDTSVPMSLQIPVYQYITIDTNVHTLLQIPVYLYHYRYQCTHITIDTNVPISLQIPVYLYHGTIMERQLLRRKIFPRHSKKNPKSSTLLPVVITSYEICMRDQNYLADRSWKFLIVDEGHRIKNLNCKLIKILKTYDSANRLLLTGTPLQNNLSELWSLLNFLLPDIFDDLSR